MNLNELHKISENERLEAEAHFLSRYIYDPTAFRIEVLGAKKEPWQERADSVLLDRHFVAVRSGNGVGKTAWLAQTVIWYLCCYRMCKIPCTAVNATQLQTVLWSEIFVWIKNSVYADSKLEWAAETISMRGYKQAWYAIARTAVNKQGIATEALHGIHAKYILYVVDEASGVPDKAIDALESAGTTAGTYGIMTSNPTRRSGAFFRAFHQERELWGNVHVTPEESTFMTEEFKIRKERQYRGKDTAGYKMRVLGEFPTSESLGIVAYEEYNDPAVQVRGTFSTQGRCLISVDPAGSGPEADAMTIGIRVENDIVNIASFHGLTEREAATKVKEFIDSYHPEQVFIDAIGAGKAMCVILEAWYEQEDPSQPRIVRVHVGMKAADPVQFFNRRSELFWHGGQAIKNKTIRILTDLPYLEQDLTELHYEHQENGKYKVESKDNFRARNDGRSTDYGDAYMLLFSELGLEVEDDICPPETASYLFTINEKELTKVYEEQDLDLVNIYA